MAVSIAENVHQNITGIEQQRLNEFIANPGWGGQRIEVKVNEVKKTVNHTTYGAGSTHVSIFYDKAGDDYQIVGIGAHDGTKGGKTAYRALWNGRGGHRVQVLIMK